MSQEIPRHYTDTPPYITFCPKEESFLKGKLKSLSGQMPSDDYLQNLAFNLRKPAELLKQWFTEESESFKHHLRGNAPSQVSKQCIVVCCYKLNNTQDCDEHIFDIKTLH